MSEERILQKVDEKFDEFATIVITAINELRSDLSEKIETNTERVEALDQKVELNGIRIEENSRGIAALDDKIEARFVNIVPKADILTVNEKLKTFDNRITRLEEATV